MPHSHRHRGAPGTARRSATAAFTIVLLAITAITATAAIGAPARAGTRTSATASYIVVLKDAEAGATTAAAAGIGAGDTAAARVAATARAGTAARLAAGYGGTVERVYAAALNGFQARLTDAAARRMARDPAVAYLEPDRPVTIAGGVQTGPPSWGLDRIDQRLLPLDQTYAYPNTATNVHAYVIDTGIRLTHADFSGRASSGFNATGSGPADDCNGHGTHVAGTLGGTAHGVAKGVALVAVRVLDCNGSGTTANVIAGVDWVTVNAVRPAVANMSIGGGASTALDTVVNNSIVSGVSYSVAAGGSATSACNYSPSRVPDALTVGATTIADSRMSSSNYGPCVDLFAPGQTITSTWYTSDTATATLSGTSMASPHVAGAAALVRSDNPGWTPAQVTTYLLTNATPGSMINPGPDAPNLLLYVVH